MTFDFMKFEILDQQHKRPRYNTFMHPFSYFRALPTIPIHLPTQCSFLQTSTPSTINNAQSATEEEMQISDESELEDYDEEETDADEDDEDELEEGHLITQIFPSDNERILVAAEEGNVQKIKDLLDNNPFLNLNYRDVGVSAFQLL